MSSTLIAEIIMNEFDWSNIAVMVKEKQFPQTNFDVLLEEFKKFLLIKFIDRDIEGNLYSPSYFVDEVWQIFLLFPKGRIYYIFYSQKQRFIKLFCYRYKATSYFKIIDYYGMCTKILNGEVVLDRNPLMQAENQPVRYQRMLDRYKVLFAMPPPQPYWEVPAPAVETMENPSRTYSESSSGTPAPATSEVTPNNNKRSKTTHFVYVSLN